MFHIEVRIRFELPLLATQLLSFVTIKATDHGGPRDAKSTG